MAQFASTGGMDLADETGPVQGRSRVPLIRAPSIRVPLILVHGWYGRGAHWGSVAAGLAQAGWPVFVLDLPPTLTQQRVRQDAHRLAGYMARTSHAGRALAEQPVVLAGYSRGGLVIRAYLQVGRSELVRGMVHVGAPHLGTPLARPGGGLLLTGPAVDPGTGPGSGGLQIRLEGGPALAIPVAGPVAGALAGPVAGALEMAPESDLLRWLDQGPDLPSLCPQLAICGRAWDWSGLNDLFVWEESASLGGRLPVAAIDLRPSLDAWHGNLVNRSWFSAPLAGLRPSDRVWPQTLEHIRRFLTSLE